MSREEDLDLVKQAQIAMCRFLGTHDLLPQYVSSGDLVRIICGRCGKVWSTILVSGGAEDEAAHSVDDRPDLGDRVDVVDKQQGGVEVCNSCNASHSPP